MKPPQEVVVAGLCIFSTSPKMFEKKATQKLKAQAQNPMFLANIKGSREEYPDKFQ